jgi:hypothetical protein
MPDCSYCGESFASEDAYLSHLESVHKGELGPIDRRRIGGEGKESRGLRSVLLAAVVVIPIVAVVYVLFFAGGAPADGPVHEHGTINGTELDFSQPAFQNPREYPAFHFEDGTEVWHVHERGVTLQYAMSTLGITVTEDSVRYDGETYAGENATVVVEVDGEPVDPGEYVLDGVRAEDGEGGDYIRIVARPD